MLRTPGWQNLGSLISTGFFGATRTASNASYYRNNGSNSGTNAASSSAPNGGNIFVFARSYNNSRNSPTNARFSFYSIGESLDLSKLDTRVSTLMTDIAAAI